MPRDTAVSVFCCFAVSLLRPMPVPLRPQTTAAIAIAIAAAAAAKEKRTKVGILLVTGRNQSVDLGLDAGFFGIGRSAVGRFGRCVPFAQPGLALSVLQQHKTNHLKGSYAAVAAPTMDGWNAINDDKDQGESRFFVCLLRYGRNARTLEPITDEVNPCKRQK
jgi:hypothetical protein